MPRAFYADFRDVDGLILPFRIRRAVAGEAIEETTFDRNQGAVRHRLQLFVQGQNLTNATNYLGYSGTMTSPFFGKPTTVREMRKIDVGIGLNF